MRLQIMISDDMVKRIDQYANQFGVSRSAFCSVMLGQSVSALDKSNQVINAIQDSTISVLTKEDK